MQPLFSNKVIVIVFSIRLLLWGLPSIEIGANNTSLGATVGASSSRSKATLMSALARVSYVLMNRYMLTASYRWDGSSRLAYENRWDAFPSLALAWDIKQEPFMESTPFDQLKLRLGYGQTGNQAVAAYSAFNEYSASRNAANELLLQLVRIGNPKLKWEHTEQYNLGLVSVFLIIDWLLMLFIS